MAASVTKLGILMLMVLVTEEMECNVFRVAEPLLTQETVDAPPPIALPGGFIDRTGGGNTILRAGRRYAGHWGCGQGGVDGTSLYSSGMGSTWVSLGSRRWPSSQHDIHKAVFFVL